MEQSFIRYGSLPLEYLQVYGGWHCTLMSAHKTPFARAAEWTYDNRARPACAAALPILSLRRSWGRCRRGPRRGCSSRGGRRGSQAAGLRDLEDGHVVRGEAERHAGAAACLPGVVLDPVHCARAQARHVREVDRERLGATGRH